VRDWLNWLVRIALTSKGDLLNPPPQPQPIVRDEATRMILRLVYGGFAKFTEIETRIRDEQDAPLTADDERWVQSEIRRQLKAKRLEEDAWPEQTSWDRLNTAFKRLRREGIITLHNAGFEESDGLTLVDEARAISPARAYKGFCFYHEQDVEAAMDYGGLRLSYGAFETSPEAMREVPSLILTSLHQIDVAAEWSGNYAERILLPGFVWQKRSPRTTSGRKAA
jgi:hypothetical protein